MSLLDKKPFIIADVGSNYRGDLWLALRQIEAAKECGCDAVKFQMYTYEELYGKPAPDSYDRKYELPRDWISKLKEFADKMGIEFMCTAFSVDGYKFIDPYVNIHKVASAEMMHEGILEFVGRTKKPFIISNGGSNEEDIKKLHEFLWDLRTEVEGRTFLLECVAAYPAKTKDYNLGVFEFGGDCVTRPKIDTLFYGAENWTYRGANGISDHTLGNVLACTAVGMGATIFEKHFDGSVSTVLTPDSPVSIDLMEMKDYCDAIHGAFSCLGDGMKRPRESELDFVKYARRPQGRDTFRPGRP